MKVNDHLRPLINSNILDIHKGLNKISRTLRDFETDVHGKADIAKLLVEVQTMIMQANECLQKLNEIKGILG